MQARVTAIIVARNGASHLERTLEALRRQTRQPDTVIAVDCGSSDTTSELLAAFGPTHLITADANRNGSLNAIAGIYSERLNVLGLMPHPENLVDPLVGGTDGRGMFESLAAAPAPKPARKKAA